MPTVVIQVPKKLRYNDELCVDGNEVCEFAVYNDNGGCWICRRFGETGFTRELRGTELDEVFDEEENGVPARCKACMKEYP